MSEFIEEELLAQAREALESATRQDLDELICECECISVGMIKEFLKGNKNNLNLDLLKDELKLGSGCSSCLKTYSSWKCKI